MEPDVDKRRIWLGDRQEAAGRRRPPIILHARAVNAGTLCRVTVMVTAPSTATATRASGWAVPVQQRGLVTRRRPAFGAAEETDLAVYLARRFLLML